MGGHVFLGISVIGPDLGGVVIVAAVYPGCAYGLPQDDVDPGLVGHPALARRAELVSVVRFLEALEMLLFELILGCSRCRVTDIPEGLDEDVPVPVVLQVQENIQLPVRDDVGRDLEPFLVLRRQVLGFELGLAEEQGRQEEEEGSSAQHSGREPPASAADAPNSRRCHVIPSHDYLIGKEIFYTNSRSIATSYQLMLEAIRCLTGQND